MKRKADTYTENKKRRLGSSITTSPRYPLSFLFSSMVHRQSPLCLNNSTQGIVVASPPQPNNSGVYSISGDIYALSNNNNAHRQPLSTKSVTPTIKKTPIQLVQNYHKQNIITQLQWNQNGTTLLSADETGKLALWNLENSVENWSLTYEVDLRQGISAILWLNADRKYQVNGNGKDCVFKREKVLGPRNPFGYLAFIVLTVHGEISVHYQRNGAIFSSFSTTIPKIGHRDISRAETGCYGMALAELNDYQRISHASMNMDMEGNVYMATYYSDCYPKVVELYNVKIKFPGKSDSGAIFCQSIPSLQFITAPEPSLQPITQLETAITHIILSTCSQGIALNVCFGEYDDMKNEYSGYYGRWTIQETIQQIPCNYFDGNTFGDDTISRKRQELKYMSGFALAERFITSVSCTRSGQLGIGLSDGSIHMEYQDRSDFGLLRYKTDDQTGSLNSSFWQVVGSHSFEDGFFDPVMGLAFSPCETHLIHMLSSGRIGSARLTVDDPAGETDQDTGTVTTLEQCIKIGLLNQTDNLDLISELIRIGRLQGHQDLPERIVNNALFSYESFFYQDDINSLQASPAPESIKRDGSADWNLARSRPAYGLAIGTYRYIPEKRVEFTNLLKAIQLPIILECFMGSCTSDMTDIIDILDSPGDNKKQLSFNPDSLWSLVSLSSWTFDYVRWILKEWNLLFNSRHPKNSKLCDLSSRPVHAVLLVHNESRISLIRILVMIRQFIQYATTSSYELQHMPETKELLQRHIKTTLTSEPVPIKDVLAFLQALGNMAPGESRWSILVSSRLPSGEILDDLKKVTAEYRTTCALPAIYLETHNDYPVDSIRKKRIDPSEGHAQSCIRCRQLYLPVMPNTMDPASFSSWFNSLARRCVCGGLFF